MIAAIKLAYCLGQVICQLSFKGIKNYSVLLLAEVTKNSCLNKIDNSGNKNHYIENLKRIKLVTGWSSFRLIAINMFNQPIHFGDALYF